MDTGTGDQSYRQEVLLKEYERLCTEIRSIESNNEKVVGFGLTLISAGLVTGIAQDVDAVFLVLPVAMVGVLFYGISAYTCIFSMAGYKRHLEERINDVIGENLLVWESLVRKRERNNVTSISLLIIYALISMCVIAVSILRLLDAYDPHLGWGMLAVVVIFFVPLYFAARGMGRMNDSSYAIATQLYAEREQP